MQTYEELQQERDALLLRVHRLSEENRSLRNQLAQLQPNTTTNSEILPKHSNLSLAEKILLFQSIFRGRTDVFARRWYSNSTNKSGYQPVCLNEWNSTLCDKKKTKCTECPNRQFAQLDHDVIFKHLDDIKDFVRNYGMVIVDECHHVSAFQFERVLRFVNAKYVYGLTATPIRKDGHQPIIFMQCGPIRYTTKTPSCQNQELRPRFTTFKNISNEPRDYNQQIQEIAKNDLRNRLIVSDVCEALELGRTPIILTQLTAHVHELAKLLAPHCSIVICLTGSDSSKQKRLTMNQLQSIPSEQSLVIIATGKYIGEGFDFPRLDTLFLALPIAWKGLVAQYTGRLHRDYEGKENVIVYDYIDIHVPLCEKMYRK